MLTENNGLIKTALCKEFKGTYPNIVGLSCSINFARAENGGFAKYWMFGAVALGRPRGMVWGGRREEGSGWYFTILWLFLPGNT